MIGAKSGTKVVVRDLFGNLPVRLKQRAVRFETTDHVERELDHLRLQIAAIALAWPGSVKIVVSDRQAQQGRRFAIGTVAKPGGHGLYETVGSYRRPAFHLDRICTILSHAGYTTPTDFGSWTSVSARTSQIFIRAAICLQPAPSKQVQFISMGIHPLDPSSGLCQVLYREMNNLFSESAFGNIEDDLDLPEEERIRRLRDRRFKSDGHTDRQLKGKGKGADRWPMFYIRIDPRGSDLPPGVLRFDGEEIQAAKVLEKTVQLIRSMTYQFLQERHFRPRARMHRGGSSSANKLSNAIGPSSDSCRKSPRPALSAEGRHQVREDHTTGLDPSSANPVSKEGQTRLHKVPQVTSFASWSRIKSGTPRAVEGLLSGLPRSKPGRGSQRSSSEPIFHKDLAHPKPHPEKSRLRQGISVEEELDGDVQILLRDLGGESDKENASQPTALEHKAKVGPQPQSSVPVHRGEVCASEQNGFEDGITVWTNSVSGKTIRINARTGLSLPDLPLRPAVEPNSDFPATLCPNDRVSLRTRTMNTQQPDRYARGNTESSTWLSSLLTSWQNPVYCAKERQIPSTTIEHDEGTHAKSLSCHGKHNHCTEPEAAGRDGRLSKAALANANILGQVDKKFILAIIRTSAVEKLSRPDSDPEDTALVLIDQHAADERCRIEELYAKISAENVVTTGLLKPVIFEVTAREAELFRREKAHFEAWGIGYKSSADAKATNQTVHRPASARPCSADGGVDKPPRRPATALASTASTILHGRETPKQSSLQVVVHTLPTLIAERCRLDPKVLIDILRTEIWARAETSTRASILPSPHEDRYIHVDSEPPIHAWLKRISSCPRGIVDLLNSRSCRSAIMFNDDLTKLECEELVKKLAKCAFPFQCAHGRPSMVVLGGLALQAIQVPKQDCKEARELRGTIQRGDGHSRSFTQAFGDWQQGDNHSRRR